uniref:Structural protein n=1 Tax=Ovine astrovirus OAstV-2/Hungary/2009 TaxID=1089360 RepID=G5D8W2_9VIRU|nr:structural protein [Ovine astrovirus OAstV-2/Hungary/2009]
MANQRNRRNPRRRRNATRRPPAETSTVTTTVSTNGQTKPTTKTTTVKTTKTAPRQQNTRQVRNFVRRELQKRTDGPKAAITQTATLTLGTLGTNGSGNLEIEGVAHLNPLLIKEQTAASGSGPIQALASQYSMWRCLSLRVVLVPTVGASAVSGTVARISLNQPGAPAQATWSGLGARKHTDATPGRRVEFRLGRRDLQGPRDGWWYTDTSNGVQSSAGPTIEIHSYGKTVSTFQATAWSGELWLVELRATWQFTNWNMNPRLLNLVDAKLPEGNLKLSSSAAGAPVVLSVEKPANAPLETQHAQNPHVTAGSPSVSEVIWRAADVGVKTVASELPPPLSWLIGGGWWFMKRVFGAPVGDGVNAETVDSYYIYATAVDAELNNPVKSSSPLAAVDIRGDVDIQQMTLPDTVQTTQTSGRSIQIPDFTDGSVAMIPASSVFGTHTYGIVDQICLTGGENTFAPALVLPVDTATPLYTSLLHILVVPSNRLTFFMGNQYANPPMGVDARLAYKTDTTNPDVRDVSAVKILAATPPLDTSGAAKMQLFLFQVETASVANYQTTLRELNRANGSAYADVSRKYTRSIQHEYTPGVYYLGITCGTLNSANGRSVVVGQPDVNQVPISLLNYIPMAEGYTLFSQMQAFGVATRIKPPGSRELDFPFIPSDYVPPLGFNAEQLDFFSKLLPHVGKQKAALAAHLCVEGELRDFLDAYHDHLVDGLSPPSAAAAALDSSYESESE